jgi:hypothetical protein
VFAAFVCVGNAVAGATSIGAAIFRQDPNAIVGASVPSWAGQVISFTLCVIAGWSVWVLFLTSTIQLFSGRRTAPPPQGEPDRQWRFGISTLLMAMFVFAMVLGRLYSSDIFYRTSLRTLTWGTNNESHGIAYCTRAARYASNPEQHLVWVVITDGEEPKKYIQHSRNSKLMQAQLTNLARSERAALPAAHQLFEVVDDHIRSHDQRVTHSELESYIALHAADWSLDALVEHAKWMREHPGQTRTGVKAGAFDGENSTGAGN